MGTRRDAALAALTEQDWTVAEVDTAQRRVTVVHSARMSPAVSERLEAEAARRGITPSRLIAELVEEGLQRRFDPPATRTVRVDDLHRAIDQLAAG